MTYPFASLPENLAAFCASLRRDLRYNIGPRELMDAAHGLELADLSDEREVRNVLRPILAKTQDDARAFDAAFDRFFRGSRPGMFEANAASAPDTPTARPGGTGTPAAETRPSYHDATDVDVFAGDIRAGASRDVDEHAGEATPRLLRASYSPLESEGAPLVLEPPAHAWIEAASLLARRAQTGTSRRWRPAARGPRFDFRRTLRTSLHTGGEPVTPRWRRHPRRHPRFVLLIDGSRSMGTTSAPALQAAGALSAVSTSTETFAFSTQLQRITRDVRRAAAGERRVVHVHHAWGGGTTIGACLEEFAHRFAARLLDRSTIVIIASDGLDVGRPDLLRESMAMVARRSAAVVWINPLLGTTGYQPTAGGMSVARPFITVLAMVKDPEGLRSLARSLKVR